MGRIMLSSISNDLSSKARGPAFLAICALILLASCGPNMRDQAKCQPLEGSSFFADGKCARDLPPNTVARGFLQADEPSTAVAGADSAAGAAGATSAPAAGTNATPTTGGTAATPAAGANATPAAGANATPAAGGTAATPAPAAGAASGAQDFPFAVTRDVLNTGHLSYNAFCSPCHGLSGAGDGMIVQRGFPAPPSLHTQRLRDAPPGYFYGVITNGFGRMYSYASRVKPDDRWAIIAYIRALQLSQDATIDDVPPEQRTQLQGATQ